MNKEKILKTLEGYVEFDDSANITRVKWNEIEKLKEINPFKKKEVMNKLEEIGFLTFYRKGNYGLIGSGMELSPSIVDGLVGRAYFTRQQDAIDYRKEAFKNARYSVNVVKYLD